MYDTVKTFALDAAGIDAVTEELAAFLTARKLDKRTVLRARLATEELLLRVMERDGAPDECTLILGVRFGAACVDIQYGGAAIDPTADKGEWSERLLANLRLTPAWSYRGGVNTLRLRVRRTSGKNDLFKLLLAAASGTALGMLRGALPSDFTDGVTNILLAPLFDAFVGLVSMFAGPLILLTVTAGVFGVGDMKLFQKTGRVMLSRYLLLSLAFSACSVLAASRLFPPEAAPSGGGSQLSALSRMLFDVLPSNIVEPFLNGNMMQIVMLALLFGVVLLTLGERVGTVARLVEEGSWVLQAVMEQVCRLIPLFVFVSLLRTFWSGGVLLLGAWKPLLLFLALLAAAVALEFTVVALRTKTPFHVLLGKVLPQTLIAFTTASSMAAYEASVNGCKRMGVDKHLTAVGTSVGSVVFMPSSAIALALFAVYLAHFYGVAVDLGWHIRACALAAILSLAAPPTPGAALTVNTLMLARLGIPSEGLLMIAMLGPVLDFFDTAGNVAMRDLELVRQADILNLLDRDALHRA